MVQVVANPVHQGDELRPVAQRRQPPVHRPSMSALGQFLLEQRWLQEDELADALRIQQEVGGRLGTSLIERGYLSEELLLRALAEQNAVVILPIALLASPRSCPVSAV